MNDNVIEFVRKRNYVLVRELGQGSCGKTVLLRDDVIDKLFVCKKYSPFYEEHKQEFFANFLREIKLLHDAFHQNVVRVFNYHLYPEKLTGYILMEYVDGFDLDEYARENPSSLTDIFNQTIKGFCHLESRNILHRDIRPMNLMVTNDGTVKIIDLGFGKRVEVIDDFDKSISLNWWCEPPNEFSDSNYNFATEVYFVGKLFEKTIQDLSIEDFQYQSVLQKMCQADPINRFVSFLDVEREILSNKLYEIKFWGQERNSYRAFADALTEHVANIENGTKYSDDHEKIVTKLESAYRNFMLEDLAPDCAPVLRCFLNGGFKYHKGGFEVSCVKNFISLMKLMWSNRPGHSS
ncbi:protein kinase family protein [Nitrosomonas sp.]|uniref:protein kinase family protein n=1 Tax=Nitrosomonas sp. TaxID=42353 RepID=UPI0027305846|nr:protein kinase family protein [Nitrosomonas sp.]MDP1786780.1 protein kinase family protein [Nitrosomonas sp.]MDP2225024.1 protein kinase family protein [Nitrosomonas sp.]